MEKLIETREEFEKERMDLEEKLKAEKRELAMYQKLEVEAPEKTDDKAVYHEVVMGKLRLISGLESEIGAVRVARAFSTTEIASIAQSIPGESDFVLPGRSESRIVAEGNPEGSPLRIACAHRKPPCMLLNIHGPVEYHRVVPLDYPYGGDDMTDYDREQKRNEWLDIVGRKVGDDTRSVAIPIRTDLHALIHSGGATFKIVGEENGLSILELSLNPGEAGELAGHNADRFLIHTGIARALQEGIAVGAALSHDAVTSFEGDAEGSENAEIVVDGADATGADHRTKKMFATVADRSRWHDKCESWDHVGTEDETATQPMSTPMRSPVPEGELEVPQVWF